MNGFFFLALVGVCTASTLVRIENGHEFLSTPVFAPSVVELPAFVVRRPEVHVPITKYTQEIVGGVSDSLDFSTGNGIQLSESTRVVPGSGRLYEGENGQMVKSEAAVAKSGSYSYTAADGTPIQMSWTADENGFRAVGSHIPTPPPMPAEIAESLRVTPVASAYGVRSDYGYAAPVVRTVPDYAAPAVRLSY